MAPDDPNQQRLNALEEAAAFTDRHAEQLSEQIVQIWQRLDALTARLGQMESRLTEMNQNLTERLDSAGDAGSPESAAPGGAGDPLIDPFDRGPGDRTADDRPPHWGGRHV